MAPISCNTKTKAAKKGTTVKPKLSGGGDSKNVNIEAVEQRILGEMAERSTFGVTEFALEEVVKFSGYKWPTAPKFSKAKQALVAKGHLEYLKESKSFRITEAALNASPIGVKKLEVPATNEAFHEQLKEHFEKPKSFELLTLLSDGRSHDRKEACNTLGYKYTTAQAYAQSVTELKTLGFLEAAGTGMFRLTNKAFPCGRP